jgi:hypothetical protein
MRIFLSYPHKDAALARRLEDALIRGGHVVWRDDQLITGQRWRAQLESELRRSDAVALALTSNWVDSPFCQWEFITAVESGKRVIPVLLEAGIKLPQRISQYQYADLSGGFHDAAVQKLLDDLLTLAVTVDQTAISGMDKAAYAHQITVYITTITGNDNVVGDGNTVARTGDISIGGSVSGQNVIIGGAQTVHGDLSITVGSLPAASADVRATLKAQAAEILAELAKQPADQTGAVQEVRMAVEDAVAEAEKPQPDKKRLEIRGENLKKAAENLAAVAPIAVKIAKTLLMIG